MKWKRKMPSQQSFNMQKADDVKIAIQKDKNDQIMDKDFCQKTQKITFHNNARTEVNLI